MEQVLDSHWSKSVLSGEKESSLYQITSNLLVNKQAVYHSYNVDINFSQAGIWFSLTSY
jgi:hypothetical protein